MNPDLVSGNGIYARQLGYHARLLHEEAQAALARGDYARAAALIRNAEILAEDMHGLVDDLELHETKALLAFAGESRAMNRRAPLRPIRKFVPRRLRMAMGTSVALSLALVEC